MQLQILREIDKLDRIGPDGVKQMLTTGMTDSSGAFNKGVGLDNFTADYLLAICSQSGPRCLENIVQLNSRINLMIKLEETVIEGNYTAWDRLIKMTPNQDQTWNNNGRPANIGWALDDLIEFISE